MALAIISAGWPTWRQKSSVHLPSLACVVYSGVERLPCAAYAVDVGDHNAIRAIIVVGRVVDRPRQPAQLPESFIAVLIASINIFGGLPDQRMLKNVRKG